MTHHHDNVRVALDLTSQGFGYAVFDGPKVLVDWGTRMVYGDVHAESITRLKALLDWYMPSTIVIEDMTARGCMKRDGVRAVAVDVCRLASDMDIRVIRVARRSMQTVC